MKIGQRSIQKLRLLPLIVLLSASIGLQILEDYIWYRAGDPNCGTQMKISSLITTTLICLLWREIIIRNHDSDLEDKKVCHLLVVIGNYSFGFYLSHFAIMMVLNKLPAYSYLPYVCNSSLVLLVSLACCIIGSKLLSRIKFGKINLSKIVGLS